MSLARLFQVTCGACGHQAPIDDFARRPFSGPLPDDQYQCPACGRAWRLELRGEARGPYTRTEVVIVPTQQRF